MRTKEEIQNHIEYREECIKEDETDLIEIKQS